MSTHNTPDHSPSEPVSELGSMEGFEFEAPEEAPIFTPTKEEFENPLQYILKIQPQAQKFGICKIKPPSSWLPPFTMNVDNITFTPRVQKLNELEAKNRIKLNFMNQVSKFWELQGNVFKLPVVDGKGLDLYALHRCFQKISLIKDCKNFWAKVAKSMGYTQKFANSLKVHYENILLPFDDKVLKKVAKKDPAGEPPAKPPKKPYNCVTCKLDNNENSLLICNGCDDCYHMFCLRPKLNKLPKEAWNCSNCVFQQLYQLDTSFGFEDGEREYNLHQFGEMADKFKMDYFNIPVDLVSLDRVEKEFWRITSSIYEDVTVEYGADLRFSNCEKMLPDDEQYFKSPWNLKNLPVLKESVLRYINGEISGMKVPWMYVGMCFAAFCWHTEDHWMYSINYLHWGEPKTWYGVPESSADAFEATVKSHAPELFKNHPDLLGELVTNINPNILMSAGVPVYRTDQCAGEFVITFPRAYHAGFNQGFNFAEAVNFAPADWIKKGRAYVNKCIELKRACVFSHDELICRMAMEVKRLHNDIAVETYLDMVTMFETEKKLRIDLLLSGVNKFERSLFEILSDDVRQCKFCKTTCFLSAVICKCSKNIVCLRHKEHLCKCSPSSKTLQFRYTIDEILLILKELNSKVALYEIWLKKVRIVLNANALTNKEEKDKFSYNQVESLMLEAEENNFPVNSAVESLQTIISDTKKCIDVIQNMDFKKNKFTLKLSLKELSDFITKIDDSVCIIPKRKKLSSLLEAGIEFTKEAILLLRKPIATNDPKSLKCLIKHGKAICIELPHLILLETRLEQALWYRKVEKLSNSEPKPTFEAIKLLLSQGMILTPDSFIENQLTELQDIIREANDWEVNARKWLQRKENMEVDTGQGILEVGRKINCQLPSFSELEDCFNLDASSIVDKQQNEQNESHLEELKSQENHKSIIKSPSESTTQQKKVLKAIQNVDKSEESDSTYSASETSDGDDEPLSMLLISKMKKSEKLSKAVWKVEEKQANKKRNPKKLQKFKKKKKKVAKDASSKDEYFLCKMDICKRPSGSKVAWVQCDECNKWFHIACLGLQKAQILPTDDFNCCSHQKPVKME